MVPLLQIKQGSRHVSGEFGISACRQGPVQCTMQPNYRTHHGVNCYFRALHMHRIICAMDATKGAMLASDVSRIIASLLLQDLV